MTGEFGVVRIHGWNRDTWEAKGLKSAAERFNYYYSKPELEAWVPKIRVMEHNAAEVHLIMNTNCQDQGIVNARLLGDLLGQGLR